MRTPGRKSLPLVNGSDLKEQIVNAGRWNMAATVLSMVVVVATAAGGWFWRSRRERVLTEKDTIVLGDFVNSTGDPVLDGTLREGLSVQFEQSVLSLFG